MVASVYVAAETVASFRMVITYQRGNATLIDTLYACNWVSLEYGCSLECTPRAYGV